MSRVRFDLIPEKFEDARRVLDSSFRALQQILAGGVLLREQFAGIVDTTLDTTLFPLPYDIPGVRVMPTALLLLRAIPAGTSDGVAISGGVITWEWRNGRVLIHEVDSITPGVRYNATLAAVV